MPIANPLVQGGVPGGGGYTPPPAGAPNDSPPTYSPPPSTARSFSIGAGGLTAPDNVNVHVGILVAGALAFIVLLHVSGFRFAVDAGVTRS